MGNVSQRLHVCYRLAAALNSVMGERKALHGVGTQQRTPGRNVTRALGAGSRGEPLAYYALQLTIGSFANRNVTVRRLLRKS